MTNNKVVLAYSGGLDTSVILQWLIDKDYDVVAYIADVGQKDDFSHVEEKALACGASKIYLCDLKEEFIEDYVYKALAANAVYEGSYLLGTSLARPLIAKKQVEIAKKEGADILCHGATGKGNDQVRFELTYMKLMPEASILSPWKDPEFLSQFNGRSDMIKYAQENSIEVPVTRENPYSIDDNIMHTSYESGKLEDPSTPYDAGMFKNGTHPFNAPDAPELVKITFTEGKPTFVKNLKTGKTASGALELFEYLNNLGLKHGIGIVDMVENRTIGMKSRGVYVTPGGTILLNAHKDLESITLDKEVLHLKEWMSLVIGRLIYNGLWFSPEMEFLMKSIEHSQKSVNGDVKMALYKGNATVMGRSSLNALYEEALASMDIDGGFDQTDAKGFIKIYGMRLKAGLKK
ncbi:MAG: argininosuccinate synthase [Candidatus Methanofastidiosia archaeon]